MKKKILWALFAIIVIIQFIKPERNSGEIVGVNHISKMADLPSEVDIILAKACYDCHSNKTSYPWYANIQPSAWFLDYHVTDGKKHLNFSEFKTYDGKKQLKKLEEIVEALQEGWMPLDSYKWLHSEAKLTDEERIKVAEWAKKVRASIVQ